MSRVSSPCFTSGFPKGFIHPQVGVGELVQPVCPSLKGAGGNPVNSSVFLCSLSCFKLERGDFLSEEWRERIANTRYSTAIECCFLGWIFGSLYNGNWEAGQLFI